MNSYHLVDPELQTLLESQPTHTVDASGLEAYRAGRWPAHPEEHVAVEQFRSHVPRPDGGAPLVLYCYRPRETSDALGCILHFHGGGFMRGSAASLQSQHRLLCHQLNCAIVSVDYRLAPEMPFPGAIGDCYLALGWIAANASLLGINVALIGVMGESAGGCLAAAVALMARDRGEFSLAFQHLLSPALDDRTGFATDRNTFAGEFIWNRESNNFAWSALLGQPPGGADISPYAAPARATNLQHLPRCFISVGALDLFVDEGIDYARRLIRSGVSTELHIYPGAFHGFTRAPEAKVAQRAARDSFDALRRALVEDV